MLRMGLRIGGHGVQIGLYHLPDAAFRRVARDFGWCRLAQPQRFSQAFERQIEAGARLIALARALAVAKEVDDGFRRIVDAHAHASDEMLLHTRPMHLVSEAHELKRRMTGARPPVLWPNRH